MSEAKCQMLDARAIDGATRPPPNSCPAPTVSRVGFASKSLGRPVRDVMFIELIKDPFAAPKERNVETFRPTGAGKNFMFL